MRRGGSRSATSAVVAVIALLAVADAGCGDRRRPPPAAVARDAASGRTARALDDAGLSALAAVVVGPHRVAVVRRGPDELGAVITAADGTRAVVTIDRCLTCPAMDAAAWERDRPALTALLAPGPGDTLAIARVDGDAWPRIELRARRTVEGVAEALVQTAWSDGATQLRVTCERTGADDATAACAALVGAATAAYLPTLAP